MNDKHRKDEEDDDASLARVQLQTAPKTAIRGAPTTMMDEPDSKSLVKKMQHLFILDSSAAAADTTTSFPPNVELQKAINAIGFSIFEVQNDLGFVGWKPKGKYRNSLSAVTMQDVLQSVDASLMPPRMLPKEVLNDKLRHSSPIFFLDNKPTRKVTRMSKYPYVSWEIASLHVAVQDRKVNPQTVDFFFGGSTLSMLASQDSSSRSATYYAVLIPGTQILMIWKFKNYQQNYMDIGFQFERFVTGGKLNLVDDSNDHTDFTTQIDHLQMMKLGNEFQVLFTAEADASISLNHDAQNGNGGKQQHDGTATPTMTHDGDANDDKYRLLPVEIKASNPKNWGHKVMFQMISSGSLLLVSCDKKTTTATPQADQRDKKKIQQKTLLEKVHVQDLNAVFQRKNNHRGGLSRTKIQDYETKIMTGLHILKSAISEKRLVHGKVYELRFRCTVGENSDNQKYLQIVETNKPTTIILPPDKVVMELLGPTKDEGTY